jgi:hypothetical protein
VSTHLANPWNLPNGQTLHELGDDSQPGCQHVLSIWFVPIGTHLQPGCYMLYSHTQRRLKMALGQEAPLQLYHTCLWCCCCCHLCYNSFCLLSVCSGFPVKNRQDPNRKEGAIQEGAVSSCAPCGRGAIRNNQRFVQTSL